MKKLALVMALVAICFMAVSCASVTEPVSATTNPTGGKVGQASGKIWLGAFGTANAGIQAAAESSGIKNISTVDFTTKLGILGLWTEYEVTITGN
ncbi:MAG: TRL-like family protein [Treponema sp.]|jgi:opacity protein-like surface antigen|nr:TRL-like family protein [Treponema sp.]